MKRSITFFCAALFVAAIAQQKPFHVEDTTRSFVLDAKSFSFTILPGGVYHFDLRWPGKQVYAASKKQGIEFRAPHIEVDAISTTKKEANAIKRAVATGGIRAVNTSPGGRSEIKGSSCQYVATGNGGTLDVQGPVSMTNFNGAKQSFSASGSSLKATLGDQANGNPLRMATLIGPVHIQIHKAAEGGQPASVVTLTGNRLVLDQASHPTTIKLSGGVKGSGIFTGANITGTFSEIVLTLNSNGEVVKFSGSGGG